MFLRNKVISPELLCTTNDTRMVCPQTIYLAGNMPTFNLPIAHYAFWTLRLDTVYRPDILSTGHYVEGEFPYRTMCLSVRTV